MNYLIKSIQFSESLVKISFVICVNTAMLNVFNTQKIHLIQVRCPQLTELLFQFILNMNVQIKNGWIITIILRILLIIHRGSGFSQL